MRELDQKLMRRAVHAIRKGTPSCYWSAFADLIVADRAPRERHLNNPTCEMNKDLAGGLNKFLSDGVVVHPFKLEAGKVAEIRQHLAGLPVYAGFHIFSSDKRQRPLAEVQRESSFAGYTADQLLRTPHLIDFFNHPTIIDFVQLALGCVPTLYSVNAWWSFPARSPRDLGNQFFHRDNDDWRFITLFLYLSDVDEQSGPHQFIAGTHTLAGTERLIENASRAELSKVPIDALDSFSNFFGEDFSANCERYFKDSIVNITGPAGTIFTANTIAIHRGLMPTSTPRLVAWARYGLGPNSNSVDLEQGPLARQQALTNLSDTPRSRYINRLLFEFDRSPDPVFDFPGQNLDAEPRQDPSTEPRQSPSDENVSIAATNHVEPRVLARVFKAADDFLRRGRRGGTDPARD